MTHQGPILIVDDDWAIRELYRRELEDEGYDVVTAGDHGSALEAVDTCSPALAVLDIHLSRECGLDLLRTILERRQLQTILLTAYSGYRDDFAAWLADAFLIKSADTSEFKDTVARLLGRLNASPHAS